MDQDALDQDGHGRVGEATSRTTSRRCRGPRCSRARSRGSTACGGRIRWRRRCTRCRAIGGPWRTASVSYFTGSHDLKAGFQWDNGRYFAENFSTSGMRAVFRNGVPDSVNTYNTPVSRTSYVQDTALFLQDKWSAIAEADDQPRPARGEVPRLAARNLPGRDAIRGWPMLCGPGGCAGLARSVAAFWRHLRYSRRRASRYQSGDQPLQHRHGHRSHRQGQPGQHDERHPRMARQQRRPDPQLNELGASTGFNFGTTNRYADNLKRPYSMEYFVEFDRQIARNTVAAAGFYYRTNERLIGNRNLLVPIDSYRPIEVTEGNSGRGSRFITRTRRCAGGSTCSGTTSQNSTRCTKASIFASTSGWRTNGCSRPVPASAGTKGTLFPGDLNNPNFQFRTGAVGMDLPSLLKASGIYEAVYESWSRETCKITPDRPSPRLFRSRAIPFR